MPGEYTFYAGSKLFSPIADRLGLKVDQMNFVVCQFSALAFAVVYYTKFSTKKVSTFHRLLIPPLFGMAMLYFCFGNAIKHLIADTIVCYALLVYAPKRIVHWLVFLFAMAYLSYIHWCKVFYATSYILDITGPLMVMTQKVTSLACSINDGEVLKYDNKQTAALTKLQRRELVHETPSFLAYTSYIFSFQNVFCGPLCFYHDYITFVEGTHVESILRDVREEDVLGTARRRNHNNNVEDVELRALALRITPWRAVTQKLSVGMVCLILGAVVLPMFPLEYAVEAENWSASTKFVYALCALFLIRCQYYFAWTLADCICNASGFGFSGFTGGGDGATGEEPLWDLVSNVHPKRFELANNWRESLEAWNCTTMHWLRRVAYERSPPRYRTLLTYILSAWWHGFYPGYYLTFVSGALFTMAGRAARRALRPRFQHSDLSRRVYDCCTFVFTKFAITYVGVSFVLLYVGPAMILFRQWYFFMHVLAISAIGLLPLLGGRASSKDGANVRLKEQ